MKIKNLLKIIFSMFVALVVAKVSSETLFYGKSPNINQSFFINVKKYIASLTVKPTEIPHRSEKKIIAAQSEVVRVTPQITATPMQKLQELPLTAMQQVSQGTYAYSDNENKIVYFRVTDYGDYDQSVVTVNGQKITIRYPKGTLK